MTKRRAHDETSTDSLQDGVNFIIDATDEPAREPETYVSEYHF
jgi:hypothetical protein